MVWNFNMGDAPKDRPIIAASACDVVTKSYWVEDGLRWNCFTRDTPPIAWQIWPDHPGVSKKLKHNGDNTIEDMF